MSSVVTSDAINWNSASEEEICAELWRWFASAKPEFERQERLRSMAPEMLDLLIEVLPYMETAESDEAYKAGAVAKVTAKIRAAISKAEGR